MTPPLPAPSPSVVTGSTWLATSGNTQTSATASEHAEYTQWLEITYHRNPKYTSMAAQNQLHNLTTFSGTDTGSVNSTDLHVLVTAHTSCKFVTGAFAASSYHQPQKFDLIPVQYDRMGYSYGTMGTSAGDYVFGPQGTIVTTQPYIRRVAKTANDVEYSLTQIGTNFARGDMFSGNYSHQWRGENFDQGGDFRSYVPIQFDVNRSKLQGFHVSADRRHLINGASVMPMYGGGYTTSSEMGYGSSGNGLTNLINVIENACALLGTSVWQNRYVGDGVPVNSQGSLQIAEEDRLPINPYYDSGQHSY